MTTTKDTPCIDLSAELAALLEHVARTAIAIRMHSAYTRQGYRPEEPEAQFDLLWLSDSLHNFDCLGRAIASGNRKALVDACDALIVTHARYGTDNSGFNSKAAFERAKRYDIDLRQVTGIFHAIREKAAAAIAG